RYDTKMAPQTAAAVFGSPVFVLFLLSRTKSKKKHFVHQKVEVFWASDPILTVFMWGINHTINDLFQVPMPVMLLPDDFKANIKMKVNNHLFNKENLPGHFKFKEYCPLVFRNLRERFGVEHQDYLVSLTRSPPGKDGKCQEAGLVLTSYDRTLIVKQISSEEVEDMHNILSEYHQHIVKCHGSALLPQFLGLYRVTVDNEDTYLLVMRNMFSHRLTVHRKYDLKGSLVFREASDKEKVKELPTFKDVDFRNNMQRVYISEEEKEKLLDKLNRDIEFLVRLKIMDYSLLLGIHDVGRAEQEEAEEIKDSLSEEEEDSANDLSLTAVGSFGTSPEGIAGYMSSYKPLGPGEFDPYVDVYAIQSAVGAPHREVYFMGLINILSQYTKKKAAHAAKTVKHGAGAEISTVHPEQYAKRFREFIANIFA
uniref:Phosphatidylinositol 5-phosphate 4-kinase type-2 gamma n=1 Tax=Sinocyclocheilus grahami TaxID=75366 RepID=A0A672K0M3_SINGR